jgi:hypothetical protein
VPTATPTAQPTATPQSIGGKDDIPGTGDEGDDGVTVTINTDILPEGTTSVRLPDGTVVPLTGGDTLTLTVSADMIEDGKVQLVALDDEGVPLGNFEAQTDNGVLIDVSGAGVAGGVISALWWILGSAAAVVIIALAVYLVMRKKRGDAGA